jgi:hypothetical protein
VEADALVMRPRRSPWLGATRAGALAVALLASAPALACPQCAGREDGGVARGVILGAFILFPFAVAGAVLHFIRTESAAESHGRDVRETKRK